MLVAINYHYIRENLDYPCPSIFGINPENIEQQFLKLGGYGTFYSQADIVAAIDGKRTLPE